MKLFKKMKNLQSLFSLFLLFLIFQNCTPKASKLIGKYSTKGLSFESDEFQFYESKQFVYKHNSDNISSNKIGKGTYSIVDKKLILYFENMEELKSSFKTKKIESGLDGKRIYKFVIASSEYVAFIGVTVILKNGQSEVLDGTVTNIKGYCQFELEENINVQQIEISYIGMKKLVIDIEDKESKAFMVRLVEQATPLKKGDRMEFDFSIIGSQLILKNGKQKQRLIKVKTINKHSN